MSNAGSPSQLAIGGQTGAGVHVRIAGIDATGIDPAALTGHVTLVAQDAHVFDGTIRDNLRLGCSGAQTSFCSTSPPRASTPRPPPVSSPASERSTRPPRS
jgi:hypothetical protein